MNITPVIFAFLVAASAAPKPTAGGIYSEDTTRSMAPPRTTYALVEPNGELWSTAFSYSWPESVIYGSIHTKKGNGKASEYLVGKPIPITVDTEITASTINLTFNPNVPAPSIYYKQYGYNKPGQYDKSLVLEPAQTFKLGSTNLTDQGGSFIVTVAGMKFTGYEGNCFFKGNFNKHGSYYDVTLTYTNSCWSADGLTLTKKGTALSGVLFPAKRYFNGTHDVFVLIVKGQTAGFARIFWPNGLPY